MRSHPGLGLGLAALLTAATALNAPSARAAELDDALAQVESIMTRWAEHRAQTINVKVISGLEAAAASDTIEQLQLRLKSLLTKKRSNREWKGYWEGESRFAEQLLEAYGRAAPVGDAGPIDAAVERAAAALSAATEAAHAARMRVESVTDAATAARAALGTTLADLRASAPKRAQEVAALEERLAETTAPISRLEAAAAGGAEEAVARLEAARAARDEAAQALAAKRDEAARAEQVVSYLTALLEGGELPPTADLAEAPVAREIATVREAAAKLTRAEEDAAKAEAARDARAEEHQRLVTLQSALRDRRPALDAWAALARDKMANQDDYLLALDSDIEAVEERLRGATAERAGGRGGTSAAICDAARQVDETPLEKFSACEAAINDDLRALREILEDTAAADLLNDRQAKALETLMAAQSRDVELVIREVRISSDEDARARRAEETEAWREAWTTYATRAKDKQEILTRALQTSKDTARTLTVSKAFFASEQESLARRIELLEARLDERTGFGRYAGALLETMWLFLRNAYMVPIYLFFAWLLLRIAGRVSQRIVKTAQKDAESRDEVQRVETLAAVARGAVKLVVYIATALLCLEALGVDTGPILGGAAIFGLAISFGSQSLVKDFVTGFFILLENQYAVGDNININGQSGNVEAITMRRTVLRDLSGQVHNIPNGAITSVINATQGWSRVLIHLGVAYGSDLDKVERVVNEVGDAMFADPVWKGRLDEPPRYIGLVRFDDSQLTVRVMFQTSIFEQWDAERTFNRRINDAFNANGISIPFPQRDVHLIPQPGAKAPALPAPTPDEGDKS